MLAHLTPKERFGYACVTGLVLFGCGYVGAKHLRQPAPIVFDKAPAVASQIPGGQGGAAQSIATNGDVVVDVTGAVKHPGVFHLPGDARVVDAVHAAGGPNADADLESINLAAKLIDSSQLRVPTKQEHLTSEPSGGGHKSTRPEPSSQIDKSGSLPPVTIDPHYVATIVSSKTSTPDASTVSTPSPAPASTDDSSSGAHHEWAKKTVSDVDVNTATVDELQALPGVGPSTAQKILDYRNEHGAFKAAADLMNVAGIGPKKLEKMRPYVKL